MPLTGLELGWGSWLLLVALGGLLALDAASWPQAMVSRPLVSGTLGGLVFGDPQAGFFAGAVLEVMSFRHPPFGGARYPDTGPAGLAAGAGYAVAGGGTLSGLLAAVLAGWVLGWAGSRSVHLLRSLNARLVGDPETLAHRPERLESRHRWAVRLDALRGALLTAALLVPVLLAVRLAAGLPPASGAGARVSFVLAVLGLAGVVGAGGRNLGTGRGGWPLLLGGGVLAAVLWS